MMESGLGEEGEEEGCYYEDEEEEEEDEEDKTPTPKLQRRADQTQQSPDSVFSPSSGQESSVCSSDDVTGSEPPKFDEKERQNSLTIAEIVHDRAKAIKDTDAAEKQKQQNIVKIRKADEKLIEAVGKYKCQVKEIQSQLEAEQLKNKQQAKEIAALQQEKGEANAALIRVATMGPKGVGESVKEQFDSLKSENEKLAERAYTAEAAVLELRKGMEDLTKRSSEVESQLETERRQTIAVMAKKERRHSESITEKDKELEQLKSKIEVTAKMVSAKEAEMQKALDDAKETGDLLKAKDNELKKLQQAYDAAQQEDATAKIKRLEIQNAELETMYLKAQDSHTKLSANLKQAKEAANLEFTEKQKTEQDEDKKSQLLIHSLCMDQLHANSVLVGDHRRLTQRLADMTKAKEQLQSEKLKELKQLQVQLKAMEDVLAMEKLQNKDLLHTNSVLENDRRRLSQTLAHARKDNDGLQTAVQEAKAEALRQKRNFDSRSQEHSEKLKELDQLRRKNAALVESLNVLKVKAATYKEDFDAERREREQIASAMVEQKDTMELQYQELKEEYETKLRVNLQVAASLDKKIDELEKKLKDEAEQAEARLKDKEATHKDDIDLATAKEITANDHVQNLTNDIQQLRGQLKQKSEELSSQIAHFQNELDATCQQRDDARADVAELERELAGKAQQVKQYIKQVEDLRRLDEKQKQEISNQTHQFQLQRNEIESLQMENGNLETQLQMKREIKPLHHGAVNGQEMERDKEELTRYRIMSYQPLRGDSFAGAGAFGSVHRVQVNNIPCIAKRILDILVGRNREEVVSKDQKQAIKLRFQKECVLLSRMRHPNIVQFMGVCYPNQDPLDLTLIMEFLPMDIEKCLQKYPNLPLPIKLSILLDVSYGLLHLHNASIIHRDLSAANVLLTPDMRAKITDFGVSKILEVHPLQMSKQSALPGALGYMPPEALWETPLYCTKLDVFSFGVVALFVAVQQYPQFYEIAGQETVDIQIKKRLKWIRMLPGKGCRCLHNLIIQCLQDKAAQRPITERLNLMLKQLSQDHPREITDIVHLEQELAKQNQEVLSLVQEREHLKKQLADAEVQRIPPAVVFPTDPAHRPQPPYRPVRYQQPPSAYGTAGGAQNQAGPPPLTKSTSVPGIHQMQYATPQQGHYYSTLPRAQHQAGHPKGRWMDPPIREDPNLSCDACGMKFAIGEEEALAAHVKTCDIYQ